MRLASSALLVLVACGGSMPQKAQPPQPNFQAMPDWVRRGSVVEDGILYGVGAVKGVRQAPLAKSVAENRARAELSKLLETYTASLMKDYAASSGTLSDPQEEQRVVQMVKTFSRSIMQASEPRGLHVAQGVTYALVSLDFNRAKELESVRGILADSRVKEVVEQKEAEWVAEMEAETARPVLPSEPSIDEVPERKVSFDWETGSCDARYLCGVGRGSSQKAADNDARAELTRIFSAKVESVSESLDGFRQELSSKTGETWFSTSEVRQKSIVSTDRVLTNSQIAARKKTSDGFVSLALIERAPAAQALRDRIGRADREIDSLVAQAKRTNDAIERLRQIRYAVLEHVDREAANADLTVLSTDGRGIEAPISRAELLRLLGAARKALKVALLLTGDADDSLSGCFQQALTQKGHELATVERAASGGAAGKMVGAYDAIIHAQVNRTSRGKSGKMSVVQMQLVLRLMDGKNGRVLSTATGSEKGTRPSADQAAITAGVRLCKKRVPKMVDEVDRYFSRR